VASLNIFLPRKKHQPPGLHSCPDLINKERELLQLSYNVPLNVLQTRCILCYKFISACLLLSSKSIKYAAVTVGHKPVKFICSSYMTQFFLKLVVRTSSS
jgi:hypothetical protein